MADIKIKSDGYFKLAWARDIFISRFSRGSLSASMVFLLNSGNSSKNKTPLWAREISPGLGMECPPPISATSLAEWWG